MKPSIPALRGPGDVLVVAPAEKVSFLGSQFDSKQCGERSITPSCFPHSRCNSLAFLTPVLLCLLLDLGTYGGVDPYGVFPLLLLLLLLKNVSSARLGESDIDPIRPKTAAPQYQPIDRKKRKGKRVEDYSWDRAA